jgi:hypothetical protein
MARLPLGLVAGLLYGALSAASMLPLQFPDKRAALLGAFLNRLAIGVVIGAVIGAPQIDALKLPPRVIGVAVALILSAADAVITKAYAPILVLGAVREQSSHGSSAVSGSESPPTRPRADQKASNVHSNSESPGDDHLGSPCVVDKGLP